MIKMAGRPKRSVFRPSYAELADVKVPRRQKKPKSRSPNIEGDEQAEGELYRLDILEQDVQHGLVKVRYIEYGPEYDEWRLTNEIVELRDDECSSDDVHADGITSETFLYLAVLDRFCVFKELAYRVKSANFK